MNFFLLNEKSSDNLHYTYDVIPIIHMLDQNYLYVYAENTWDLTGFEYVGLNEIENSSLSYSMDTLLSLYWIIPI